MIEVEMKGKRRLCFLVKQGEAANVVIPIESLTRIDYERINAMESKGGELMRTMRETTLDNGMNALVQYQNLLMVIEKPKSTKAKDEAKEEKAETSVVEVSPVRKRGRPKEVHTTPPEN